MLVASCSHAYVRFMVLLLDIFCLGLGILDVFVLMELQHSAWRSANAVIRVMDFQRDTLSYTEH